VKVADNLFDYIGYSCASHCRMRIFKHDNQTVVVMTEVGDNPGTSVTNMVEHIATQACEFYNLDPARCVFIEHYPDNRSEWALKRDVRDSLLEEHFSRAMFNCITREGVNWCLAQPHWRPIVREELERWTGEVWDAEKMTKTKEQPDD